MTVINCTCKYYAMAETKKLILQDLTLCLCFSIADEKKFQQAHHAWVEEELKNNQLQRNRLWSEAIAIGNNDFVEDIHCRLKDKNIVGKMVTYGSMTVLKEPYYSP